MSHPNYITVRGLERIQREVHWLEKVERPKVVAEVAYAASLGDRADNADGQQICTTHRHACK